MLNTNGCLRLLLGLLSLRCEIALEALKSIFSKNIMTSQWGSGTYKDTAEIIAGRFKVCCYGHRLRFKWLHQLGIRRLGPSVPQFYSSNARRQITMQPRSRLLRDKLTSHPRTIPPWLKA